MNNNKRIAQNTLLLYFRMLFMMTISLYTSRVILDTLGTEDYGTYNVVAGFVSMFLIISGAMTTASQRYISFEIGKGKDGNVKTVFTTCVIIHIALALITILFAESIGVWFINNKLNFSIDRYGAANWVFQISLISFAISIISVPYNAAIIAYERMSAFAYIGIFEATMKLLIAYLLMLSPIDKLIFYATLLAAVDIILRFVYGIYCKHHFQECRCNWKFDKQLGKNMGAFVSWNLIGSLAGIAKEQGINILLNIFFGSVVNAARGIAFIVMGRLASFVNNFQTALNPQIVKSYASHEKERMFSLVFKGSKFSYLLLMIFSIPIIIETPYILNIWLVEVPEHTTIFLRIVMLTGLVDSLSGTLITSMHASGKVRDYQIIVGGLSFMTFPFAYILFNMGYKPEAAFFITLFMAVICHFARLVLLKKSIQLPIKDFLKKVTFNVLATNILSMIPPILIYQIMPNNFSSFCIVTTVSIISSIAISYCFSLSLEEQVFIKNAITKTFKKKV